MRRDTAALWAGWLLLCATGAGAQTYRVLDGTLTDAEGRTRKLGGALEASLFEYLDPPPVLLLVDDFALEAGDESFTPREPIVFEGLRPVPVLQEADLIQVEEDGEVSFLRLHDAAVLLGADEHEVHFRSFELREGEAGGGRAVGETDGGPAPRRLDLEGVLYQVDQSFALPDPSCGSPPGPPDDGGVVIGGDTIVEWEEFDIDADETVAFVPPGDAGPIDRVTGGDPAQIGGSLVVDGGVVLISPALPFVPGAPGSGPPGPPDLQLPPPTQVPGGPSNDGTTGLAFLCSHLFPLPPQETEIGRFTLAATAAEPVEIRVWPWRRHARARAGGLLLVTLSGSAELDVRDVVAESLRLGPGEAAPLGRVLRLRPGRDRHADLLAFFRARDAEIAFGDPRVCLHGETVGGSLVEGCDALGAPPRRHRRR